jgi:hypothetical protein
MQKREPQHIALKKNLLGYYIAIGIIIFGYILLAIGGADSFTSKTLGPIVIVFGFLLAVPIALLYRSAKPDEKTDISGKDSKSSPRSSKSGG